MIQPNLPLGVGFHAAGALLSANCYAPQKYAILTRAGAPWVILGLTAGAIGIALCGAAGRFKELDLKQGTALPGGFSLTKGLLLSLVAGVLSAVYGFSLEIAAPLADLAEKHGAGIWKGNVGYAFANSGAFVLALAYTVYLGRKNRSFHELRAVTTVQSGSPLTSNYLLAALTGTLWYGQFFFYNLGHVHLGTAYSFSSWAIHMIMLVLFSNLLGVLLKEWRRCRVRTHASIALGLLVLCAAIVLLTYANWLGQTI